MVKLTVLRRGLEGREELSKRRQRRFWPKKYYEQRREGLKPAWLDTTLEREEWTGMLGHLKDFNSRKSLKCVRQAMKHH